MIEYDKCINTNSTLCKENGMIVIDYQDRTPIYEQIVERVQTLIIKSILKSDEQLPSVRKLAVDLAINPNTIQKAFAVLEQQGFIYSVKGRGSFVASNPKGGIAHKREEFYRQLKETVSNARDLKIELADLQRKVEEYYGEAQHD